MNQQITFDPVSLKLTYPDGIEETLEQYKQRCVTFDVIQSIQNAFERLKVLYQNPGAFSFDEYEEASKQIESSWDDFIDLQIEYNNDSRNQQDAELPPRTGHIFRLAEIIREVNGNHDKGAIALAMAILSHPGFSECCEPSVGAA
jgi:hypothetical protein